jgi:3',5'-cyclic AMP phosphodiesterase CpdA
VIRFLHLSDIHFGGEHVEATAAAADYAVRNPVDLIIVTGDLTQFGEPAEFAAAARWLAALPGKPLVVPGNHDSPYFDVVARFTNPFGLYAATIGRPDAVEVSRDGYRVHGANSARGAQLRLNWSKGTVSAGQARRGAESLEAAEAGCLRVFACHHPLTEITGGPMTGRVRGGPAAAERLAEAKADLILTGHVHTPFAHALPFGDGKTYAVGASTLSVRLRGAPPGFNLIEADAETLRVTALGWTGARLEPQRTWALPRRSS